MSQIREELLYNLDKGTCFGHEDQGGRRQVIDALTTNNNVETGTDAESDLESNKRFHNIRAESDIGIEGVQPLKTNVVARVKLPEDWKNLDIHRLAAEVETCGVDPVIIREHLIQNHDSRKIKSEKKSVVLPSNWKDKIRDELIEDICTENELDKEVVASELEKSTVSSPAKPQVTLPVDWRTMTREELYEVYGIRM